METKAINKQESCNCIENHNISTFVGHTHIQTRTHTQCHTRNRNVSMIGNKSRIYTGHICRTFIIVVYIYICTPGTGLVLKLYHTDQHFTLYSCDLCEQSEYVGSEQWFAYERNACTWVCLYSCTCTMSVVSIYYYILHNVSNTTFMA